jgi:hypothetical protein
MGSPEALAVNPEDREYIRSYFVTTEELANSVDMDPHEIRAMAASGSFPQPTYVLEDGSEWYPPIYSKTMKQAIQSGKSFADTFRVQIERGLRNLLKSDKEAYGIVAGKEGLKEGSIGELVERIWTDFRGGGYGACLKSPVCGSIIKKDLLMSSIESLISSPRPDELEWRRSLRKNVDALDSLELPFADIDRVRFGGPVSRDRLVTAVRQSYPQVFSDR